MSRYFKITTSGKVSTHGNPDKILSKLKWVEASVSSSSSFILFILFLASLPLLKFGVDPSGVRVPDGRKRCQDGLTRPNQPAGQKNQHATHDDLEHRRQQRRVHVALANP